MFDRLFNAGRECKVVLPSLSVPYVLVSSVLEIVKRRGAPYCTMNAADSRSKGSGADAALICISRFVLSFRLFLPSYQHTDCFVIVFFKQKKQDSSNIHMCDRDSCHRHTHTHTIHEIPLSYIVSKPPQREVPPVCWQRYWKTYRRGCPSLQSNGAELKLRRLRRRDWLSN